MPSSAVPFERRKRAASHFRGDRHYSHPGLLEEAIEDRLRRADLDGAGPRDPSNRLINRDWRGAGRYRLLEPPRKGRSVSLFDKHRHHRRGVQKHQKSPESSSKKALSAGSPPGFDKDFS